MTNHRKLAILLLLAATSTGVALSQPVDEVLRLQYTRSMTDGKLYEYLRSGDAVQRAEAALALANIQDTSSIAHLSLSLSDPEPAVRRNAAFALGQMTNHSVTAALLMRLKSEAAPACIREIIDAIGKTGSQDDERALVSEVRSMDRRYCSATALSIGRFAYRKVKDSLASEYAVELLEDSASAPFASYALMRIGDSLLVKRHRSLFVAQLRHNSPEVRMWIATVLGNVSDRWSFEALVALATSDPDWRVRVNAVRALKIFPIDWKGPILAGLIRDKNEHVSLTSYSMLGAIGDSPFISGLADTLKTVLCDSLHFSWRQRGEAALLLAKNLKEQSIPLISGYLREGPQFRARLHTALGETRSLQAIHFLRSEFTKLESAPVSAAIGAYGSLVSNRDSAAQSEFCRDILPLLERHDIGVSFAVAIALQDTSIRRSIKAGCLPQLIKAFADFKEPDDVEPMAEFIAIFEELNAAASVPLLDRTLKSSDRVLVTAAGKALEKISGKKPDIAVSEGKSGGKFFSDAEVKLLKKYRSAVISTSKGEMTIKFRSDAAPFTVLNFILLAHKHFFDGLTFHRVVPNFVIQGGDPLGTGFGGPGYDIRTECHPDALYSEGAVGMASAGKDTEGSQFFVTHCPTPHLDGRYSVFGYTRDMHVVEEIQVGDNILSVKLKE